MSVLKPVTWDTGKPLFKLVVQDVPEFVFWIVPAAGPAEQINPGSVFSQYKPAVTPGASCVKIIHLPMSPLLYLPVQFSVFFSEFIV